MSNDRVDCNVCKSSFDKMFLMGKQGNIQVCPVCGSKMEDAGKSDVDESDWITWYYYGFKEDNGETRCLNDQPIDLDVHGDNFFLIKEFKAPPRDENGSSDRAKEVLRKYFPDAFVYPEPQEPVIRCPRCGSKDFTLLNKGYSLMTGFLGSGRIKRVCNYCKKEF